ncbi:MAG: HNH endonuclease signature motif containing protein [Candidatus Aenigmatarchaeota archaeon]
MGITCRLCNLQSKHEAKGLCPNCYFKEYRKINISKIKIRNKSYWEKNKERLKQVHKNYNNNHSEEIKKWKRRWYQNNREFISFKHKIYRDKNKSKIKEINKIYNQRDYVRFRQTLRSRFRRYGYDFAKNAIKLQKLAKHNCMKCGENDGGKSFDVHHIVPFALIKNNELWNLEYLCRLCHTEREKYFRDLAKRFNIFIPSFERIVRKYQYGNLKIRQLTFLVAATLGFLG